MALSWPGLGQGWWLLLPWVVIKWWYGCGDKWGGRAGRHGDQVCLDHRTTGLLIGMLSFIGKHVNGSFLIALLSKLNCKCPFALLHYWVITFNAKSWDVMRFLRCVCPSSCVYQRSC